VVVIGVVIGVGDGMKERGKGAVEKQRKRKTRDE